MWQGGGASPNKNSDAFIHLLLGSRQEDDVETVICYEDDYTGYQDEGVVVHDIVKVVCKQHHGEQVYWGKRWP